MLGSAELRMLSAWRRLRGHVTLRAASPQHNRRRACSAERKDAGAWRRLRGHVTPGCKPAAQSGDEATGSAEQPGMLSAWFAFAGSCHAALQAHAMGDERLVPRSARC